MPRPWAAPSICPSCPSEVGNPYARPHTSGEILLKEFLKPMYITPHALAIALGVPATSIADIVHQRRAVTADTAAQLSRYFGTKPDFWLNLQSAHDISAAERDKAAEL